MNVRRARFLLLIPFSVFIIVMAHNARSQSRASAANAKNPPPKSAIKKLPPSAQQWVETTLRKMSVDEKVGQLLFTTFHGSFTPTDNATYAQMMHDVNDLHVGGFINVT